MSHGGKRPNSGRKPGAATRKTREIADKAALEGITPLEVMLTAMRDLWALGTDDSKLAACGVAKDAAPYVHAKLSNIDMKAQHEGGLTINLLRFADGNDQPPV